MPRITIWLTTGCFCVKQSRLAPLVEPSFFVVDVPGWEWGWTNPPRSNPRADDWHYGFSYSRSPSGFFFGMTLVYPALLTTLAASLLWRWDFVVRRRERVGLCKKCGYDRRGLAAGAACPECGEKQASKDVAAA